MADRIVSGHRVSREGAAHGVALELVAQDRGADDRLERGRAYEALGGGGHEDPHPVARKGG
jgi:hypothetical protein